MAQLGDARRGKKLRGVTSPVPGAERLSDQSIRVWIVGEARGNPDRSRRVAHTLIFMYAPHSAGGGGRGAYIQDNVSATRRYF
jgi:hypothetical protein